MADDKLPSRRSASMTATRSDTVMSRPMAISLTAVQNASSRQTLVLWPAITTTTWLHVDEKHFLVDLVRKQCDYPTLSRIVLEQYGKHRPDALLIEDHGSGSALIQDLKQRHEIGAIPITPTGDKVVRLSIVSPMCERGEIFVPQNPHWLMEFLDELLRFPQARFDDQVDSVTQYLNWHRNRKTEFEVFWE